MNTKQQTRTASLTLAVVMALGGLGSIPATAATPAPVSATFQTSDSETDASWDVKAVRSASYIRSGPGTNHRVVDSVQRNDTLTVRAVSSSWWELSGSRGFIAGSQLVDVRPAESVTRYVSASNAANVRSGPSSNASVVGGTPRGAKVSGSPTNNGYLKIGHQRYIHGSVLSSSPINAKPTPPKQKTQTFYSKASNSANVRTGPGLGYRVVDGIPRGAKVTGTVHGNSGFVRIKQGRYVSLSVLSSSPVRDKPSPGKSELRRGAEKWGKRISGQKVIWRTDHDHYGSSFPTWDMAKHGFWMNDKLIEKHRGKGTQSSIAAGRGIAVHEGIHGLQAKHYGSVYNSPVKARHGVKGWEREADCGTQLVGKHYGLWMPTFYLDKGDCTASENATARALLKKAGVL